VLGAIPAGDADFSFHRKHKFSETRIGRSIVHQQSPHLRLRVQSVEAVEQHLGTTITVLPFQAPGDYATAQNILPYFRLLLQQRRLDTGYVTGG
jgi:hypothetical protein